MEVWKKMWYIFNNPEAGEIHGKWDIHEMTQKIVEEYFFRRNYIQRVLWAGISWNRTGFKMVC
jgi:hypothetical protein